jgi:hypothetical protein
LDQVTLRRRRVGLVASDPAKSAGGVTLYAPQTAGGLVFLVDEAGQELHRWQLPVRPGRDAVLLPNGNLGYNGSAQDGPVPYGIWPLWRGGEFLEVTPDGKVVWSYRDVAHHHDARWLANGNLLYTAAHPLPEPIRKRLTGGVDRTGSPEGLTHSDVVREVDRQGRLVWEWKAWEHLAPEDYPVEAVFDRTHWPMINGLDVTRAGLVLMSLRTTSGVIAVDRSSGKVVWRIPPGTVAQQHTPVELDTGNILIFDNGNLRGGSVSPFSRVIEVNPSSGAIAWQYADPMPPAFFTPYMGGAERLWNGNTFITESAFGRLFEVTPAGETVWEFVIPQFAPYPEPSIRHYVAGEHNSVFRAHRYRREDIPWL